MDTGILNTSYAMLSSDIFMEYPMSHVFSWYTREPKGSYVYQEITSDNWGIPYIHTYILFHVPTGLFSEIDK